MKLNVFAFFALQTALLESYERVLDFGLEYYEEFNFDGLLGFTIAEAQLLQILETNPNDNEIKELHKKSAVLRNKILPILPKTPQKMITLGKYLLDPENWKIPDNQHKFVENLGIYTNWTRETIVNNKHAEYKGVFSDYCLLQVLNFNCFISSFCEEMMLAPRVDTGYLLTHRLLFLQVMRIKKCSFSSTFPLFNRLTESFCSLILKEAQTNQFLGFPAHDIFLEQVVLCGIEGYSQQFVNENWARRVIEWQRPEGCFQSNSSKLESELVVKRTSNVISFGCTDHTTGLGAAALALHLKHLYL